LAREDFGNAISKLQNSVYVVHKGQVRIS
jgi:hypothetical protein